MGSWALVLQLYFAPRVLYRVHEGRVLLILALSVAGTFRVHSQGHYGGVEIKDYWINGQSL